MFVTDFVCKKAGWPASLLFRLTKTERGVDKVVVLIPWIDNCFGSLGDTTIFSTRDAYSRCQQVEIDEQNPQKTKFTIQHGFSHFSQMRFGLKSAPGTFQQAMDVLPINVIWQSTLVYLDDIIILSPTPQMWIKHVPRVLTLWNDA